MSNINNLKKAEVIVTINSSKQMSVGDVKIINFPKKTKKKPEDTSEPEPPEPNFEINYSKDEKGKKNYIKSNDDNKRGDKYSQIIINNLHPGFNPLQVVLIGKDYNTTFSEKSINFVDVFSNNSGSEMLIDKTNNKLILNNFISQITSNKNVTSQFTRAKSQNHVIIKIIILYDLEYNW